MKRYLIAGGVGTMVFAAALGSAAALNVTDAGVAQYGQNFDVTCDTDGVQIAGYSDQTDASGPSKSTQATVTGIAEECFGKTLVVGIVGTDGSGLTRGNVIINDVTERVDYNGPNPYAEEINVSDIGGVRVTIG